VSAAFSAASIKLAATTYPGTVPRIEPQHEVDHGCRDEPRRDALGQRRAGIARLHRDKACDHGEDDEGGEPSSSRPRRRHAIEQVQKEEADGDRSDGSEARKARGSPRNGRRLECERRPLRCLRGDGAARERPRPRHEQRRARARGPRRQVSRERHGMRRPGGPRADASYERDQERSHCRREQRTERR
jgi:hypothetical protein